MAIPGTGSCHRCRQPGHWAADCPYAVPAASKAEHQWRIALFVRLYIGDELDPATERQVDAITKQRLIEQENAMWRDKAPGRKSA
jgi:hypothetical protein